MSMSMSRAVGANGMSTSSRTSMSTICRSTSTRSRTRTGCCIAPTTLLLSRNSFWTRKTTNTSNSNSNSNSNGNGNSNRNSDSSSSSSSSRWGLGQRSLFATAGSGLIIGVGIAAVLTEDSELQRILERFLSESSAQVVHADAALSLTSLSDSETGTAINGPPQLWSPPSREEMLNMLKGLNKDGSSKVSTTLLREDEDGRVDEEKESSSVGSASATSASTDNGEFDLLIVGGGATGVGCAVDAVTRGLKVALVERDDYASGTSSRSTKLVHGGVRYLEKAFLEMDYEQYKLVVEALHERGVFLQIAPYLSYQLPIMLPLYQYWKIAYYWAGSKAYDFLAGKEGLSHSYFLSKRRALEAFPMLKSDKLVGAMVYYDGAHNDSRMNVAIALTAISHGAVMANHVEVVEILKRKRTTNEGRFGMKEEEIYGAVVRDNLTGDTWTIRAKGIINATGPFTDGLRKLDAGIETKEIVAPSAGVHIILPNYYSPRRMGLIDPNTSDGRVIFFLPWQGNTIAGTTDSPTTVSPDPMPTEKDIAWILKEVENYLDPDIKVRRGDVLAAWSGIRPLVRDPAAKNTAALVRNHMINVSESGLLTIAGGKWTTYRAMAKETIDKAIEVFDLRPTGPCVTEKTLLYGSHNWNKTMFIKIIQHFGIETEVAQHLSDSYGDRAWGVAAEARLTGLRWPIFGKRLSNNYPYIEAEVRYAVKREYACTVVDVIARRTRLAMLNARAAKDALPKVIEIMAEELNWTPERQRQEYENALVFLTTMGLQKPPLQLQPYQIPSASVAANEDTSTFYTRSHFVPEELSRYKSEFAKADTNNDGRINEKDLSNVLKALGVSLSKKDVENLVKNVKPSKTGTIEFGDFLEVMADIKEFRQRSLLKDMVAGLGDREQFSITRSGGGV